MASSVRKRSVPLNFPWKSIAKIVVIIGLIMTFAFLYPKLKSTDYFPIKDVKIFGVQHLNHDEVQSLVLPFVSKGFFFVDVDRIKERILQLPWVAQVVVRRVWPNQVIITVNEKIPFALWNDASLLSEAGELFTPAVESYPNGLPALAGPPGEQIRMTKYYARMNSLLTPLHFKIARLELTPGMAWTVTLDNGVKLNVGHKDVLTRISHFVKVYPKIVGDRVADVEYIDLRYSNGMAVRWKSVT
ncbi:MAG: cell division protein FtsQ/DivIB [Gammaproteobacteria bacterium]|nr:cell division protein FtsQ/DivIB [Gammaproteobacteria bacterium]